MNTRLIGITQNPEKTILYCARVSNPSNQNSEDPKLLSYCIKNGHWSIFEMANMIIEIETSRAIAQQILRHKSFSFQEFSLRYSEATEFEVYPARRQDKKNRQNSINDLPDGIKEWFQEAQNNINSNALQDYKKALEFGISKESARFLLPLSTRTKLYMNGSVRSWLHYLDLRCAKETQKEHRDIADSIKSIFIEQFPNTSKAKGWS